MPRDKISISIQVTEEVKALLTSMAGDSATEARAKKRAAAILLLIAGEDIDVAASKVGMGVETLKKAVQRFNDGGWQSLLTVQSPRGGDFLANYDQGFWAERLTIAYLESSKLARSIPYGTSRSEPFSDLQTFKKFAVSEFLLQAWSAGQRWKRPDLLLIPRKMLEEKGGNDVWSPDLQHWDNDQCRQYVDSATGAIEVEQSLWQVRRATVKLSFTIKDEDLEPLRNWINQCRKPLYVIQVFYDSAYVLPFETLEFVISSKAPKTRRVKPEVDRFTKKLTYRIPLGEGFLLGDIPEPDVEGKVYKAPNGRVTVYGRLVGSQINPDDHDLLEAVAQGRLRGR